MSLAEQTARVAGGGKNALKKILQKLGVTVGDVPIDQYADLADQISDKLLPDNLLSADTASLCGLPATAVPDEVLAYMAGILTKLPGYAKMEIGTYVGTGDLVKTINLQNESEGILVLAEELPSYATAAVLALYFKDSKLVFHAQKSSGSFSWYLSNVLITLNGKTATIDASDNSNFNFNITGIRYKYLSFCIGEI